MRAPKISSMIPLLLTSLIILSTVYAFAATNSVPSSRMDDDSFSITANDLKPSDCSSLNLTNVATSGGETAGNDLLLGTSGADTLTGDDGDDCIVGGGGDDTLRGQKGNDIVLGQAGDDSLRGNQDTDICDGGAGTDSGHASCETELNIP